MNVVKEIQRINKKELELSLDTKRSWHDEYKDSAYVFIGGLDFELTEGDVLAVLSQYGEIVNINLVRDKQTKKSKGFCFLAYEDQRSSVLAVDNLNGIKVAGRTLRVDHVKQYRRPRDENGDDIIEKGCAPKTPTPSPSPERSPTPVKVKKKKRHNSLSEHDNPSLVKAKKKKKRRRDSVSEQSDIDGSPDVKRRRKHRSSSPEVKRKKHKEKKNKKIAKQDEKDKTIAKPRVPEIPHVPPMGGQGATNSYLLHARNQTGVTAKPDGKKTDDKKDEKPKFELGGFFDANNPFGSAQPKRMYDYRYDFGRDSYKPTRYQ